MWARFFEVYAWWLSLDIRFSRANVLRFYADYSWKWCDELYLSEFSYMSFSLFETTKLFVDFMNFQV